MKKLSEIHDHVHHFGRRAEELFDAAVGLIRSDESFNNVQVTCYLGAFRKRLINAIATDLAIVDASGGGGNRVLTVGGWPGATSIALALASCEVVAVDHPAVLSSATRRAYDKVGVSCVGVDMSELACAGTSIDFGGPYVLVECCECIEHWNFNPTPVCVILLKLLVAEQGILFLSVPNIASLYQRVRLLLGRSIYAEGPSYQQELRMPPGREFERHWREYTKNEVAVLLEIAGAEEVHTWWQFHERGDKSGISRRLYNVAQALWPPGREHIGAMARRVSDGV